MTDVGLQLHYFLPRTQFTVALTKRLSIVTEADGSRLREVVDASVSPSVAPDTSCPARLSVDAGLLEKVDVTVKLDDRGVIESVNCESSRDLSPVVSLVGKLVGLATTVFMVDGEVVEQEEEPPPPTLEDEWAATHASLESHRQRLMQQSERLLLQLGSIDSTPQELVAAGAALEQVQSQLAVVSQARREWISGQGRVTRNDTVIVASPDLSLVPGDELPTTLPPEHGVPTGQADIAADYGILLVACDPHRPPNPTRVETGTRDAVVLRRSRPASVAVYARANDVDSWELRRDTVMHIDLVDELGKDMALSLDGWWTRSRKVALDFHADRSLKSFEVSSSSTLSTLGSSVGDVLDAVGTARKAAADKPSADEVLLEKQKLQLDLLKTADELEVLSVTRYASTELAIMKQGKEIRDSLK